MPKEISDDSRLLQHTVSSARRKLETMEQFPGAFSRRAETIKSVTHGEAHNTAFQMRTGLEKARDSTSELNQQKQSMTYDFDEPIKGGHYFKRQFDANPQKATLMAMKDQPPLADIFDKQGVTAEGSAELRKHVWLNSIVGTEDKKTGIKSGGQAMLEHAELVAKSRDQRLGLAAFNSEGYWAKQGFEKTEFEQREEDAPAPFTVMTKIPKPKI